MRAAHQALALSPLDPFIISSPFLYVRQRNTSQMYICLFVLICLFVKKLNRGHYLTTVNAPFTLFCLSVQLQANCFL